MLVINRGGYLVCLPLRPFKASRLINFCSSVSCNERMIQLFFCERALMLAKQKLTSTSTQRTNNREKLKKGQRKHMATELAERRPQNGREKHTNPPRPTKRPNIDEPTKRTTSPRPPTETTKTTRGWPSIHQKKQLHGGEASAGDDQ